MKPIADPSYLGQFFSAYTEHAFFDEMGVTDTRLIDYVAGVLVRFVHFDQIYPKRSLDGRRLMMIADMVDEIERSESVGQERRELFRHIGDLTLFWTGLFPEAVGRRRFAAIEMREYTQQGKRSYYVASTYQETPEQADQAPVLRRLSEEFEICAAGLRRARDLWEAEAADEGQPPELPRARDKG